MILTISKETSELDALTTMSRSQGNNLIINIHQLGDIWYRCNRYGEWKKFFQVTGVSKYKLELTPIDHSTNEFGTVRPLKDQFKFDTSFKSPFKISIKNKKFTVTSRGSIFMRLQIDELMKIRIND